MKTRLTVFLGAILPLLSTLPVEAQSPPKLTTQARIDLFASSTVGSLNNGRILTGEGVVDRQGWRSAQEQPRTYSIHLPIIRYGWTEFTIQFLPERSGTVQLSLMGPWEEVRTGQIYLQEVYWDALETTGTTLPNGSFEQVSGTVIQGWTGGASQVASASVPAVDGNRYARVWHNNPLSRSISVSGGTPVTVRCFARAVLPSNFQEMVRIQDRNTPAHQTALRFARGINFGNYLEARTGTWDIAYSSTDFARARAEGFDHVRLPVAWHLYTGREPDYLIAPGIFATVDSMVAEAGRNDLGIMINLHHFDEFTSAPDRWLERLKAIWRQVAAHYASAPASVVFEILNEPREAATAAVMNQLYEEVIPLIRQTNPHRTLFVGTSNFNSIDDLNLLLLPGDDDNLIATVHIYDPFLFTHQGASWVGSEVATLGIAYPGPPSSPLQPHPTVTASWVRAWVQAYNSEPGEFNPSGPRAFEGKLRRAAQWSQYFGRPVHVGEFGCFETADPVSRVNFYRDMREVLDREGLGWAMWDWKAGFYYLRNGIPAPSGMREAIFPHLKIEARLDRTILGKAAIGKRIALERTSSLAPANWQPVVTETLTQPVFQYTLPREADASFYRLVWHK